MSEQISQISPPEPQLPVEEKEIPVESTNSDCLVPSPCEPDSVAPEVTQKDLKCLKCARQFNPRSQFKFCPYCSSVLHSAELCAKENAENLSQFCEICESVGECLLRIRSKLAATRKPLHALQDSNRQLAPKKPKLEVTTHDSEVWLDANEQQLLQGSIRALAAASGQVAKLHKFAQSSNDPKTNELIERLEAGIKRGKSQESLDWANAQSQSPWNQTVPAHTNEGAARSACTSLEGEGIVDDLSSWLQERKEGIRSGQIVVLQQAVLFVDQISKLLSSSGSSASCDASLTSLKDQAQLLIEEGRQVNPWI